MPIKTFLTPKEIKAMIASAPTPRDKAILSFLADSVPGSSPIIFKRDGHNSSDIEIVSFSEFWNLPGRIIYKSLSGEEIKILDYPIWVLDYVPRGACFTKLKYIIRHPYKGKILRINSNTAVVDVSPNHSIYSGKFQTGIRLRDANTVELGDYLSQLSWSKVRDGSMAAWFLGGQELAWLYGFFFAEGSCYSTTNTNHYNISLSNKNVELLTRAEKLFFSFFGKKFSKSKTNGVWKYNCGCSKSLFEYFRKQFYTPEGLKKVPNIVLNAPKLEKLAFLAGYNLGDGRQNSNNECQEFTTNSPTGAMGLLWLAVTSGHIQYSIEIRADKPTITVINLARSQKGHWPQKLEPKQVKKIIEIDYDGYLYDIGTESNTFITGVGLTRVHNTGCRVSELLSITPANIDLERREVMIPHLKRGTKKKCPKCSRSAGRSTKFCARCGTDLSKVQAEGISERSRLITIGNDTATCLVELIKRTKTSDIDKPLIRLTRQMVYKIVRDAGAAVGLEGRMFLNPETGKHHYVHPHDFRSALAVDWLKYAGGDVGRQQALQKHLGHLSFETTLRYNKLSPEAIRTTGDEVRNFRWDNK